MLINDYSHNKINYKLKFENMSFQEFFLKKNFKF